MADKIEKLLAPLWNAVREFVDRKVTGSLTLNFKDGMLRTIDKREISVIE